ncbi:MAG: hypothetical protein AB8B80_15610 [Marinicellaceae bacterium]
MNPEEQIENIIDKESFMKFLEAFISDRESAEALERKDPEKYQWGGANNWQNSSISHFLDSSSCFFIDGPHRHEGNEISWKDLANFLYFGKIYE